MSENEDTPKAADPPFAPAEEVAYHRWASERVSELIAQEDRRHSYLDNKATLAATVTLGFAAYCARELAEPLVACSWTGAVGVWCLVTIIAATVSAYRVVAVRSFAVADPLQLVDPAVLMQPVPRRHVQFSDHLRGTLQRLRADGKDKARGADRAQQWALVSMLSMLGFLVMQRFR